MKETEKSDTDIIGYKNFSNCRQKGDGQLRQELVTKKKRLQMDKQKQLYVIKENVTINLYIFTYKNYTESTRMQICSAY